MAYGVGVDLGTTFTAAAVRDPDGHVEMVTLGRGSFAVPSALFVRPDGEFLVGQVAVERGRTEPDRLVSAFKRRLGDSTPFLLGGAAYSAERLSAELLRWVLDVVAERHGGDPASVVVTHPANWGDYRREMMRGALEQAGVPDATLLTEPEAAAMHYAARERVDPGDLVAVYDLGGGTFDTVVLERTTDGFTIRGTPMGIERLGGIDLDHIVMGMVGEHLDTDIGALDSGDPEVAADLADFRAECIQAKIALSSDESATVRVRFADERADVGITRGEFEERAASTLSPSVDALAAAIAGADATADDVAKILLVGGSSRIPLVAKMVFDALGRPVAVDADPKAAVALGTARVAEFDPDAEPIPVTRADEPADPPDDFSGRTRKVLVAFLLAVVGVGLGFVLLSGRDDDPEAATGDEAAELDPLQEFTITGTVPENVRRATVGLRVNAECDCNGPATVAVEEIAYLEGSSTVSNVPNGDFEDGAIEPWGPEGSADSQVVVGPDGATAFRVEASPDQSFGLNSGLFDVTVGADFEVTFLARVSPDTIDSAFFAVFFLGGEDDELGEPGTEVERFEIPVEPAADS